MKITNRRNRFIGTDITRRFCDLSAGSNCMVVHDEPSILRGAYRVILIHNHSQNTAS
jgi:hypothetical protein